MRLRTGERLGEYEIIASLGSGGMGEVYRARDTRLHREVAIKVISEETPMALARFEREARAVAALSHPNILAIHHTGSDQGSAYIVTELLEGESLRDRITRGPLPWRMAIDIATQVCDGLAAAHALGVVHRDLKPENVFITRDGRVKILDFGLARLETLPATSESASTAIHTRPGTFLGTLPYMAPERLRGEDSGAAADLFALGCILHEMLTGRSPFARPSEPETVTAILRDEPPELTEVPPQLAAIVQRCLAKEKAQRFHSASDLQFDLRQLRGKPSSRAGPSRAIIAGVFALIALIATGIIVWRRGPRAASTDDRAVVPGRSAQRSSLTLTQLTATKGVEQFPAWSPDGSRIVFSRDAGRLRKLYVRSLAEGAESLLTRGEADEIQPSWSPDGRSILFVRATDPATRLEPGDVFAAYLDGGDIWLIDLDTRREEKLIGRAFNPAWSPDGKRIAFDASWSGPRRIWVADARGHNAQQVTTDTSEGVEHVRPRWSPDGTKIVFQNVDRTRFDVRVADLAGKELTWITNDFLADVEPVWSPGGDFIYFSSARGGGYNLWRVPIGSDGGTRGPFEQITTGAGQDVNIAISPAGRAAFAILRQNADLWRLPLKPDGSVGGPPEEVVATTREDSRGAWSPDGQWIAFNSDRSGDMNIWIRSLADGRERQLTTGPGGDFQANWSPDGSRVVFFSTRAGSTDIWEVGVETGSLKQLTHQKSTECNPFYSPDGRQIAYFSDADGRLELWVMDADGKNARQLTRVGVYGHYARWTSDSSGIYVRMALRSGAVELVPREGGEPRPIAQIMGGGHMSFSPDGSMLMDVIRHKVLWVSSLTGGKPRQIFEFDDSQIRIDYPVWSPDGKWVLFDRFRPEGGDIWATAPLP